MNPLLDVIVLTIGYRSVVHVARSGDKRVGHGGWGLLVRATPVSMTASGLGGESLADDSVIS